MDKKKLTKKPEKKVTKDPIIVEKPSEDKSDKEFFQKPKQVPKRKLKEEEQEDFEEEEDYVDKYQEQEGEELSVSFDVNQPVPSKDLYGSELFLKNFLLDTEYNYVGLTEHLLGTDESPNTLTNVVKVPYEFETTTEYEWNCDVYGLFSLVDLKKNKKLDFVKSIKKFLMDHCQDKKQQVELEEILDAHPTGLIVNERVVNLPVSIAPHLHAQLFEEIEEKQKKDELSKFKYFIIITKVYEEATDKRSKKVTKFTPQFYKEEEELYYNESILSYAWTIMNKDSFQIDMQKNLTYKKLVMIVKRKSVADILKKMKELFDDSTME